MGHKVSVVRGVKSDHFYEQKNGINEIWVGDVEVISRLPFGGSDQEQAGWPVGGVPKIPWHHFIIPFQKRTDEGNMSSQQTLGAETHQTCTCPPRIRLSMTGYFGLYTKMDPAYAFLNGGFMIILAYGLNKQYWDIIWHHRRARKKILAQASQSGTDAAATKRELRLHFRSTILRAGVVLFLSIFFAIMGLPAFAAGVNHENAAAYVLVFGFLQCFLELIIAVAAPIWMPFIPCQPKPVERSTELEDQTSEDGEKAV